MIYSYSLGALKVLQAYKNILFHGYKEPFKICESFFNTFAILDRREVSNIFFEEEHLMYQ